MNGDTLLLSIKPAHAERIFNGAKTVELRRLRPHIGEGDRVVVYVTSPVQAVVGWFVVESLMVQSPPALWSEVRGRCGLSRREYRSYFCGASYGVGIFLRSPAMREVPVSLDRLRACHPGFRPPRGYRYLKSTRACDRTLRTLLL